MAESLQQLLVTNFGLSPSGYTGSQGAAGYTGSAGINGYTGSAGAAGTSILIGNIQVTDSSYTVLDDTAVDTAGGYVKITGSGFASGCTVLVNQTAATSVTFISATEVRAQLPATAAGTYIVYVVNPSGDVAIRVNGVTFSALPAWVTGSSLTGIANTAISIQLSASSAAVYALQAGSSLPSGVTLSNVGLISGTVSGISSDTVYNFTVIATDAELQDSPRSFALTISVSDPYFKNTTLLLSGNGTNLAQNNTFVDSSSNNFTITRSGNATQGTFSPYGANWSNYFDGAGDYLAAASPSMSGTWTVELWWYPTVGGVQQTIVACNSGSAGSLAINIWMNTSNQLVVDNGQVASGLFTGGTFTINAWNHVAVVRNGTTTTGYINGASVGSNTFTPGSVNNINIGRYPDGNLTTFYYMSGYISNLRVVTGTAVYTSAFTPPTAPLTAISGTSLLTCQSNRFIDNSTNNYTITRNGDVSVQRFSPFGPGSAYSASVIGGSAYFDGTGDWVTTPNVSAFDLSSSATNFTIEAWVYNTGSGTYRGIFGARTNLAGQGWCLYIHQNNTLYMGSVIVGNAYSDRQINTTVIPGNAWTHVALVKTASGYTAYVNGVGGSLLALTGGLEYQSTQPVIIGALGSQGELPYLGYISDARIVKGTALYTTNFTPPTSPLTAVTNTQLLLKCTNAGIIDGAMMNNLETVGDTKISTTQSKFGGSSMTFDGTGDYLQMPTGDLLNFGTGDFTVECWTYLISKVSSYPAIFTNYNSFTTGAMGLFAGHNSGTTTAYQVALNGSGFPNIQGGTIVYNTWVHLAVVRASGLVKLYVNGTNVGTTVPFSTALNVVGTKFYIGSAGDDLANGYINGYIDDFRVTKGFARYTANFTPPALAFIGQ